MRCRNADRNNKCTMQTSPHQLLTMFCIQNKLTSANIQIEVKHFYNGTSVFIKLE